MVFSSLCAIVHRDYFFRLYQQNKSLESRVKFRQASNHCKRVLEAAKLAYATKTKDSITSKKLGSQEFWQITNSVLKKGKSAIPPLFNSLEVLASASDKAKLFTKNFSNSSNFDDLGISLPVFPSRTNLKLHNISITPKESCFPDCWKVSSVVPASVAFFDFQYVFESSPSIADLATVVSDRITRAFNRSGATRAVALDISNSFDRVWHASQN